MEYTGPISSLQISLFCWGGLAKDLNHALILLLFLNQKKKKKREREREIEKLHDGDIVALEIRNEEKLGESTTANHYLKEEFSNNSCCQCKS